MGSQGRTASPNIGGAGDPDPTVSLQAVACALATSCVAVGDYQDASGNELGLLLTKSGSSWVAGKAPLPADAPPGNPGHRR